MDTTTHMDIPESREYLPKRYTYAWLWDQPEPHHLRAVTLYDAPRPLHVIKLLETSGLGDVAVLYSMEYMGEQVAVISLGPSRLILRTIREGLAVAEAMGADVAHVAQAAVWLARRYPLRMQAPEPERIRVRFTYMDRVGEPAYRVRDVDACSWAEIRRNYSARAQERMGNLVRRVPDDDMSAGKIGILYGPPGTGKTHMLRCLAREWPWANLHYIMDAENLFRVPSYMLGMLLTTADDGKWSVILCEDAEQYIGADSKRRVGEGLSRLLNAGDGLIGQGLRILFLFSTNVKELDLHPAIIRPRRCFERLEVPLLSPAEASEWTGVTQDREMSLAECYEAVAPSRAEAAPAAPAMVGQYL